MKALVLFVSLLAGAQSFATEYRAKPVTLKGEILPQSVNTPSVQILEAKVPVYRVETRYDQYQTTCKKVECNDTGGDGSTGDWKNFFNVPAAEKPAALAAAIKGIGKPTAELIVKAKFFSSKPRSWRTFSKEIQDAQRELARMGYAGRFEDLVLEEFGDENAKNLGYYVETQCHVVTYPCTMLREVEKEIFAYNLERNVQVSVKDQVLQDFERDTYSVTVGFEPKEIDVKSDDYYNDYRVKLTQVTQRDSKIEFAATKRNLVAMPSEAGSASLSTGSNGLVLSGSVNSKYLPSGDDANSRLMIMYKVCTTNLFGGCGKTQIDWTQAQMTGASFSIDLPGAQLRKGAKHKAWYKFVRLGSKYYSDKGVEQKTDAVKYNKN